jgi:hypothetical protein
VLAAAAAPTPVDVLNERVGETLDRPRVSGLANTTTVALFLMLLLLSVVVISRPVCVGERISAHVDRLLCRQRVKSGRQASNQTYPLLGS